jgi:hypothetical protein
VTQDDEIIAALRYAIATKGVVFSSLSNRSWWSRRLW